MATLDCDNSPTKSYLVNHREDSKQSSRYYDLSFGKRPAEELYDLKKDPHQLTNVAVEASYVEVKQRLADRLTEELKAKGDPRANGKGEEFDKFPYYGGAPLWPARNKK